MIRTMALLSALMLTACGPELVRVDEAVQNPSITEEKQDNQESELAPSRQPAWSDHFWLKDWL